MTCEMILEGLISIILSLMLCADVRASSQTSIHYTVRDGLPSSTVYAITQDGKGFMWIGTEAGLARFDGAHFQIYTTQDGLPDNEVLGVMYDRVTDRLWITTYSKAPCYYYQGKFYNKSNDTSLAKIVFDRGEFISGHLQPGLGVFLTNNGTIYRCADGMVTKLQLYTPQMDVRAVQQWGDSVIDVVVGVRGMLRIAHGQETAYDMFCCDSSQGRGKWIGNTCFFFRLGRVSVYHHTADGGYVAAGDIILSKSSRTINVVKYEDHYILSVYNEGVYSIDTALHGPLRRIWAGRNNDINIDNSGNVWITTSDDGIYVIRNKVAYNFTTDDEGHDNLTALYYQRPGRLYCGNSDGQLYVYSHDNIRRVMSAANFGGERVRGIAAYDSAIFLITSGVISHFIPGGAGTIIPHWGDNTKAKNKLWSGGQKCILKLHGGDTIMVGLLTSIGIYTTRTQDYSEVSVSRRIITMAQHPDGPVYCGSLDGIFIYTGDTATPLRRLDTAITGRITSMCFTPDRLLWIGTPSDGILVHDGHRIIARIDQRAYLSYHGAICRRIIPGRSHEVWVATNSGINKIKYSYGQGLVIDNITPLTMTDGLLTNDVNDIAVDDSIIYAATARGLTVMNENRMMAPAGLPVYIASVRVNDKDSLIHDGMYQLSHDQNNIRIEYVAVCLPSADNIRYEYRLLGSGSDRWTTTSNTSIDFRSLSSGTYTFEVVVLDKFGVLSKSVARIRFKITPAFYTTWWFMVLVMITILTIGFLIIRSRFRRQQQRYEREQSLQNKIIDLEQQALKAQMNPHFIFNCLTAVQHFVNSEDMYSANMYLSNFARLIRKTLDLSGEQYVSLDTEIAYLRDYIQMECLRFGDKFVYQIEVAENVDTFEVQLPPMLLQPIVENAIRHGLRNLEEKAGLLLISFTMRGNTLYCTVDDNGIGRAKARELKTTMHVEYQSKGMSLTEMRIHAINQISDKKIHMEVKDKYDDNNRPDGTLFILTIEQ